MLEDIISNYRKLCTRTGQFDFILNTWVILITIFGMGGILALAVFIKLGDIPESIRFYVSFLVIPAVEIIYITIAQIYIYYKQKKYIKAELISHIKNERNEQIKIDAQIKLNHIKEDHFKLKYIISFDHIQILYNKMKFNEFLKRSKINSNNVELIKENIKEHIKDKNNFKEIIDIAFWGIIFLSAFNPIVEYIQSIYIPATSSVLDASALINYLVSVTGFIFIAFVINHMIHKINDSKNKSEKRLYLSLSEKLSDYNFNLNDLERYIE